MTKRPIAVTILSAVYIVMGAVGFIYHFRELAAPGPSFALACVIEAIRVLAIVAGIFMLKARDWARWLAIAWIALHVLISFYNGWQEVVMHAVFLAVIVFFLTRPAVNEFFRRSAPRI